MTRIAVLDYGMGNLRSVEKALEHVGAEARVTRERSVIDAAAGIVLPGVGAFPRAMEAVRALELDRAIAERNAAGVPVLGVCLGLQLLFGRSPELGGAEGLRILDGEVEPLAAPGLKVPQIGWNEVSWTRQSRLTAGLPDPCAFYHVHSYAVAAKPADVLGTADYGESFVSAVEHEGFCGVQFHPEKSGPHGLALLSNFVAICSEAAEESRAGGAGGLAA